MRATASAFRMRSVRAFPFWTQSVKANVVRTMRATTSAFWTWSVRAFAYQTQSVKANFFWM